MNIFRPLLFVFVILSPIFGMTQPVVMVQSSGIVSVQGNVSPNEARSLALDEAKINALKKAGIVERISAYQLLYSSQYKNDYSQFFSSDISSEIQGSIKSYKITDEKLFCRKENEIAYELTIDAEVIKYDTKSDPAFDFLVQGVQPNYKNNEPLEFSIKSTKSGYLTVFNITDTEASLIYPNRYEAEIHCKENETYKFPDSKIKYFLSTKLKQPEQNRLIFVFTKTRLFFIKMDTEQLTTKEIIFSWIYSIPPDQRKVEYVSFTVQN